MSGDGPQTDPNESAVEHTSTPEAATHVGSPTPDRRFSLPAELLQALAALDAGAEDPLLDETPLAYPDLLDDSSSALVPPVRGTVETAASPAPIVPLEPEAVVPAVAAPKIPVEDPVPLASAPAKATPALMSQDELDQIIAEADRLERIRRKERDASLERAMASARSHPVDAPAVPFKAEPPVLLSQQELDRALRHDASPVAPHEPPMTASAPGVTQAELDAFIEAQLAAAEAPSAVSQALARSESKAATVSIPDDDEPLSQDELDRMLHAAMVVRGEAPGMPTPSPSTSESDVMSGVLKSQTEPVLSAQDEGDEVLSQADLDALIAGSSSGAAPATEPAASEILSQADLDALIAGASSDAAPAEEPAQSEILSQADLDALIAGASAGAAPAEEPAQSEVLSQADLDALIAGASAGAAPPAASAASEVLSQADLDALIAGATSGAAPSAEPSASEVLSQADLDALIAGATSGAAPPAASAASEVLSQADLDALIAGAMSSEPAATGGGPDEALPEASFDQAEIDALIRGQVDETTPMAPELGADSVLGPRHDDDALNAAGLDSLLVGHDPGQDISVSDEHVEALLAELDKPRAAPVEEEPLSQDLLDAILASAAAAPEAGEVGLENFAAAASTAPAEPTPLSKDDLAGLSLGSVMEEAPVLEAEPESDAAPLVTPARAKGPNPIVQFVRRHPARLAAAIAAGVLVGAWTYVMLDSMRVYKPSLDEFVASEDAPLDVVVAQARRLTNEGAYSQAVTLLDPAIDRAHASPERSDAEYLRAEALYKGFSGDPYTPEYDKLHARIDETLSHAPQHPRAPEALLWKAHLFELADLPYAEADIYAEIITNHGDAANLDAVLYDAAKLALHLDEPLQAVQYTRQILQQFPGSPVAGGARLLLADAYQKAGSLDDARTLYVRVAQSQPGSTAGAEAHYRLGQMSFDEGNYARAIQDLNNYLDTSTSTIGNDKAFLLLARAYQANGQLALAQDRLEELINFFPESDTTADAYVVLSQVLEDAGKRDEAVNLAMQAAARFPDNPGVLQNSGEFLGLTGNPFGAATALVNAHKAGADNPELLLTAARYYRAAGMPRDAQAVYEQLREEYPRASQALTGVIESAEILHDEGRVTEAINQLEEMLATTKDRPERLDGVRSLLEMTREMGMTERTIELAGDAAGLSNEPEVLAESALALFDANALAQAQEVFNRIDLSRVRNRTAFDLLMGLGKGLLQVDPVRGLDRMEEAYLAYPNMRSPQSDLQLLDVYLATGRAAAARRVVMELASHVQEEPVDTAMFLDAATSWGDWLFGRGDYRAAAEAYGMVVDGATANGRPVNGLRSDPNWAKFQRANALFELANYEESLPIYEQIAASDAPWASDARIKADYAQLEQRLRGAPANGAAG